MAIKVCIIYHVYVMQGKGGAGKTVTAFIFAQYVL